MSSPGLEPHDTFYPPLAPFNPSYPFLGLVEPPLAASCSRPKLSSLQVRCGVALLGFRARGLAAVVGADGRTDGRDSLASLSGGAAPVASFGDAALTVVRGRDAPRVSF